MVALLFAGVVLVMFGCTACCWLQGVGHHAMACQQAGRIERGHAACVQQRMHAVVCVLLGVVLATVWSGHMFVW
jgi:hypothetical protein